MLNLAVWNAATMVGIKAMNWYWTGDTKVTSVALANITGGVGLDIVTGGAFFDGTRWNGQIIIWNGTTLVGQKVNNYFWVGDTNIASIAVGNVSRGTGLDIVVGGAFFDGTRWNSQLTVWNATTLVGEKLGTGSLQVIQRLILLLLLMLLELVLTLLQAVLILMVHAIMLS